jgi:hypothetical protein
VIAPTVPQVATSAKAAGVYGRCFAFDATPVRHITIYAKALGVYALRSAFDAEVSALAVVEHGGFGHPLRIFDNCSGRSLVIVAHIASPTHTANEIGAGYAAPRTSRDGRGGTFLMVVAHVASAAHTVNETLFELATPWTFDF